jgi:hypothetical protein
LSIPGGLRSNAPSVRQVDAALIPHQQRGFPMRTTISIIALSIAATAGLAAPATAADTTASAKAKEVKYCLTGEALTGSRLRSAECLTKAEWAQRGVDIDALRRQ